MQREKSLTLRQRCAESANGCCRKENLFWLRFLFVFVVLAQIVAAIAVVFYLSYSAATTSGEKIFDQLMDTLIQRSRHELDSFLKTPLRTVRILRLMYRLLMPTLPFWDNATQFNASTMALFYTGMGAIINQAPPAIVSVGFGSPFGAAFATRSPNEPPNYTFMDGTPSGNITYVKVSQPGNHTWDRLEDDVPMNATLAGMLAAGNASVTDNVPFTVLNRAWYMRVCPFSVSVVSGASSPRCLLYRRVPRCRER